MIDFETIEVGNKVSVVGMGAPGFARLGETLEVSRVGEKKDRVWCKNRFGEEAFFALTCGASRLELIEKANDQ